MVISLRYVVSQRFLLTIYTNKKSTGENGKKLLGHYNVQNQSTLQCIRHMYSITSGSRFINQVALNLQWTPGTGILFSLVSSLLSFSLIFVSFDRLPWWKLFSIRKAETNTANQHQSKANSIHIVCVSSLRRHDGRFQKARETKHIHSSWEATKRYPKQFRQERRWFFEIRTEITHLFFVLSVCNAASLQFFKSTSVELCAVDDHDKPLSSYSVDCKIHSQVSFSPYYFLYIF